MMLWQAYAQPLAPLLANSEPDVTEENLQARARGTILMALSNKFGHMVISTGNKSENAVGYSTLYGDMVGGFDVLKMCIKPMSIAWRTIAIAWRIILLSLNE